MNNKLNNMGNTVYYHLKNYGLCWMQTTDELANNCNAIISKKEMQEFWKMCVRKGIIEDSHKSGRIIRRMCLKEKSIPVFKITRLFDQY